MPKARLADPLTTTKADAGYPQITEPRLPHRILTRVMANTKPNTTSHEAPEVIILSGNLTKEDYDSITYALQQRALIIVELKARIRQLEAEVARARRRKKTLP